MGWGSLVYCASAATAGASNVDFSAASDPDFTQRNSHYVFTEQYELACVASCGASLTKGRFQVPTWNAIGEFNLWGANRSATVPTNNVIDNYYYLTLPIPQNEEFQVQWSNNLGASTEQEQSLLVFTTQDWSANLPNGRLPIRARASFTVTPTVAAWSGPQTITLSSNLRGGVYAVVGARCQGTNSFAFRIIFPRYRLYHGRKLRPGWVVQNAVGDAPFASGLNDTLFMGEWGRFHTFELPQVEVFGITAGSVTYQVFLDLVFLGEDISLLNQGLGGGM